MQKWGVIKYNRRYAALSQFLSYVRVGPSFSYNGPGSVDTVDRSTYTFNTLNTGTARAGRLLVFTGYATSPSGTNPTLDTATIDGNSATIFQLADTSGSTERVAFIIYAVVATGTTATVVLNFLATMSRCGISGGYALYDISSTTPTDTASSNADAGALDLDVVINSIVIGISGNVAGTAGSWTGISSNFDAVVIEGTVRYSGGSIQATSASTPLAIDYNWGGSPTFVAACSATWV